MAHWHVRHFKTEQRSDYTRTTSNALKLTSRIRFRILRQKIKVPLNTLNDNPGCIFGGNLQPGSRLFQSGLNPGMKSNPAQIQFNIQHNKPTTPPGQSPFSSNCFTNQRHFYKVFK